MAEFAAVCAQYQELSKEWTKGAGRDKAKVGSLLEKLKFSLTTLSFLPTKDKAANKQELTVSRDTLEIGAQYSVAVGDIPAFERYMAQLQTYYHDYSSDLLAESPFMHQLLGLNLLCLLAQNRVAEFHTELERLNPSDIQNNVYIRHPVSLEQYIMEGSYNKVLLAKGNVPAESYNFFIDILMDTVRNEIASCMEKAYADISCGDAARMLSIPSGDMGDYAAKKNWVMEGGRLRFIDLAAREKEELGVPSLELASMAITFAREMEQIV